MEWGRKQCIRGSMNFPRDQQIDLFFHSSLWILICLIYGNTIYGGYVWDDRAAIIDNHDVHGLTTLTETLSHDFWGQNIKNFDSHKSYRPITVLSFRFNHYLHGLEAWGFHVGNIALYIVCCSVFYTFSTLWLKDTEHSSKLFMLTVTARVAAVIFAFHPVHVEAVASLVGRADTLCGVFYILCLIIYTQMLRLRQYPGASTGLYIYALGECYFFAICASLSKEIGITVVGMLCVIEVVENSRICTHNNASGSTISSRLSLPLPGGCVRLLNGVFFSFTTFGPVLRICSHIIALAAFMLVRLDINGAHRLYPWTKMENHIHLLPTFEERMLSYAQSHFWYLAKLIYPRYLSFDYGYTCFETVHSYMNILNVLPLVAYALVFLTAITAVWGADLREPFLMGFALFIIPLFPALNILFPVGTVLAERLLFLPCAGFAFIVADLLCSHAYIDITSTKAKSPSISMTSSTWYYWSIFSSVWNKLNKIYSSITRRRKESKFEQILRECRGQDKSHSSMSSKSVRELKPKSFSKKQNSRIKTFGASRHASESSSDSSPTPGSTKRVRFEGVLGPNSGSINAISVNSSSDTTKEPRLHRGGSQAPPDRIQRSRPLLLAIVVAICTLYSYRVVTRNLDWNSEKRIYKSALSVCPLSVKALSNYATFLLADGDMEGALRSAEQAISLYPDHVAAHVNAGLALDRMGLKARAVFEFDRAVSISPNQGKAHGYKGSTLYEMSNAHGLSNDEITALRRRASDSLDRAILNGFNAPSILHTRGSVAMDMGDNAVAVHYLGHALRIAKEQREARGAKDVPHADGIREANTYNQIGNAYQLLNRFDESIAAFESGIASDPKQVALYVNLANAYRRAGRNDRARAVMQAGIEVSSAPEGGNGPPAALLNNMGLLALDEGQPAEALALFQRAVVSLDSGAELHASNSHIHVRVQGGGTVLEVLKENMERARVLLSRQHV